MERVARWVFVVLVASPALAAPPLFPTPLHLVRRVEDGATKRAESVDEYCYGNRIVTVRGARVIIADYAAQQLTEIDRQARTYSIARFDEIAKHMAAAPRAATPKVTAVGMRAGVDAYEIAQGAAKIEIGINRAVGLSRDAVEALIGAAYPNSHRPEHDAMLDAAGGGGRGGRVSAQGAEAPQYGLPAEQTITYSFEGSSVTFKTSIVRVDAEMVPAELLLIPPGATLVESRHTRIDRELHDIESLPARKP